MRSYFRQGLIALLALGIFAMLPVASYAQATITGVVKDTSGAVLPGVTVEASSPALIEKTRSGVTDGSGQYRIVDLEAGSYIVTFTLTGFSTIKREGLELSGTFVATINAELKVGTVEETVTVTGETPIVDVQSATRQSVVDRQVIDSLPTGRSMFDYGVIIPGILAKDAGGTVVQDVGANKVDASLGLQIHGSRQSDQTILLNGVSTSAQASTGYATRTTFNPIATQEMTLDYSAVNAEVGQGGVRINMIPKDGGNIYSGTFYTNFARPGWQGDNYDAGLQAAGLKAPDRVRTNWDINPGFGGPIKKDKLWFYVSSHFQDSSNYVGGIFYNKNANNPAAWNYVPDTSQQGYTGFNGKSGDTRVTWQATRRNKFGTAVTYQVNCGCPQSVSAALAPEADAQATFPRQTKVLVDWSSPVTNRLLLEAGFLNSYGISNRDPVEGINPQMIQVSEQSNGLVYRAPSGLRLQNNSSNHIRFTTSYITGSHAIKVGIVDTWGYIHNTALALQPVAYRFNNGVPNQITESALPLETQSSTDVDMGIFAQDTWTIRRLTLGVGIRFDYFTNSIPAQALPPTPLTPNRNLVLPAASLLAWKDLTPKFSSVYDLFGNGKTAVKVSLNKYVEALAAGSGPTTGGLTSSTSRSWTDRNGNFVPDCNLTNGAAQTVTGGDICGAIASANFGLPTTGTPWDPNLLTGWNKRGSNWEFAASVQHQLAPRIALNVGYYRRWFNNFQVTDNLSVAPSDFTKFSITAPVNPRLPNGGGYIVPGLYDLNPAKFGVATQNFVTLASNFGNQIEHWNGFDATVNARPGRGLILQGGMSTGRTTTDSCEVRAAVPESALLNPYCATTTPFQAQVKFLGSYTVPKIAVQVSGTMQSYLTPQAGIAANFTATNAIVLPSLGRPLSGGAANVSVNLIEPSSIFPTRVNQLDLRVGKLLRFGRTRSSVNVDLYNVLNSSAVLTENASYATFRQPTTAIAARFAKISMQFDF